MKGKKIFRNFAIIYFSVLAILCGVFIYYVVDSLILYENSEIDKYIANLVIDIANDSKKGKINNYLDISDMIVSKYEDTNTSVKEAYANIFKTKTITYNLVEDTYKDNPTYDIYGDDKLLFTIKLKANGDIHRMGLLTFPNWEIEDVTLPNNRGVYYYDIHTLDRYKVLINGKELDSSNASIKEIDSELEELGKFTTLPGTIKYEINGLTTEADIEIFDDNEKVAYIEENGEVFAYDLYTTDSIEELNNKIVDKIDVLLIARMWSKFLTDDLSGSYHGYSTIKEYLIEDTHLWNMAYNWAHGVDITFVSNHTLLGFDNEKVSDCELYSDKAFSCEVYLEKNMRLRSGKAKQDIMHDRLYFAYYEDAWKLVSMKAITE